MFTMFTHWLAGVRATPNSSPGDDDVFLPANRPESARFAVSEIPSAFFSGI